MAFNAAPSEWISSWAEDGTTASFDLGDLTQELTAAEADASSGDWRDCFFSLLDHTFEYYNGLATADKPTQLIMQRSASLQTDGTLRRQYTITVDTDIASEDVAAES